MRARWVMLIAGVFLVFVILTLCMGTTPAVVRPAVHTLGSVTNNVLTLLVTNTTGALCYVGAGVEFHQGGVWVQGPRSSIVGRLLPDETILLPVFVSTSFPRRIRFMYARVEKGRLERWLNKARAVVGIKRNDVQ